MNLDIKKYFMDVKTGNKKLPRVISSLKEEEGIERNDASVNQELAQNNPSRGDVFSPVGSWASSQGDSPRPKTKGSKDHRMYNGDVMRRLRC